MIILLWFAICFASAEPTGYDIIAVAGQSNASGYGHGIANDPQALPNESEVIFQMGRLAPENFQIIPAKEPLSHWDVLAKADQKRVGFALPFARRHARKLLKPGRKILIVPSARGGSNLIEWMSKSVLYRDFIGRVRMSLAQPGENRIVAFLWHQGESNLAAFAFPQSPMERESLIAIPNSAAYAEHLKHFINSVRIEFPDQNFPVLVGEVPAGWLPRPGAQPLKDIFNAKIAKATSELPNAHFVRSTGLAGNSLGDVHFSAAAQIEFGQRYFDLFAKGQIRQR